LSFDEKEKSEKDEGVKETGKTIAL